MFELEGLDQTPHIMMVLASFGKDLEQGAVSQRFAKVSLGDCRATLDMFFPSLRDFSHPSSNPSASTRLFQGVD